MAEPFFVTTPSGDRMVILTMTEAEYASYVAMEAAEDAPDVAALDAAKADPTGSIPLTAEETARIRGRK